MVVYSFVQLYYTISGEELFVFKSKKCRIYAACGVSQTPKMTAESEEGIYESMDGRSKRFEKVLQAGGTYC